jgi:sugar diacid utilization regulator
MKVVVIMHGGALILCNNNFRFVIVGKSCQKLKVIRVGLQLQMYLKDFTM